MTNTYAPVLHANGHETTVASKKQPLMPSGFTMTSNECYDSTIPYYKDSSQLYATPTVGACVPPTVERGGRTTRSPEHPGSEDEGYSCTYDYVDPL